MKDSKSKSLLKMDNIQFEAELEAIQRSAHLYSDEDIADMASRLLAISEQLYEPFYACKRINALQWMAMRRALKASDSGDWASCCEDLQIFLEYETPLTVRDFQLWVLSRDELKQWEMMWQNADIKTLTAELLLSMIQGSIEFVAKIEAGKSDDEISNKEETGPNVISLKSRRA
jgi:hypothetical protein